MLATVVVKVALTVDADSGASIFLSLQALRPADGAAGVHAHGVPVLSAGEPQATQKRRQTCGLRRCSSYVWSGGAARRRCAPKPPT